MSLHRAAFAGAVAALVTTAVVVPSVSGAAGTCDADWPMFQHDPGRTASASCSDITTTSVATLAPKWFIPTNGDVTSEPAIARGHAYVGDGAGLLHATDLATGKDSWTFDITHNQIHVDRHAVSYGRIDSSAAVADVPKLGSTVFVGGGGTVYAVDALHGTPRWATDVDPDNPKSSAEVESSPVVWHRPGHEPVVFVGMDTNEDKGSAVGGVVALDARTGALLWKYDAETGRPVHSFGVRSHAGTGCGDIWSSPALDSRLGLLYFGAGNCNLTDSQDTQRLTAIRAATGRQVWTFDEPRANHGHDMDFGASPVLTTVGHTDAVVQAGKSGWVYVLDRRSGHLVRSVHAAQGSDIGGFIGSVAVAADPSTGHPVLYGDTAIPAPDPGPDPTVTNDPTRLASLHAVDLVTGTVLWQGPAQTPSYAPVTVVGGVVFAPDTTQFSVNAYLASNGAPVWHTPVAAATSSGVAVSGQSIVFGTGTYFSQGAQMPPQVTGIWCFQAVG